MTLRFLPRPRNPHWMHEVSGSGELTRRLVDSFLGLPPAGGISDRVNMSYVPPVNIAENEVSFMITLEVPGMTEEDIDVHLMGTQLQISGVREPDPESAETEVHRVESRFGSFARTITLPTTANLVANEATAKYKNGLLRIRIPKAERTPSSRIEVRNS